jgi:hypothetical protein
MTSVSASPPLPPATSQKAIEQASDPHPEELGVDERPDLMQVLSVVLPSLLPFLAPNCRLVLTSVNSWARAPLSMAFPALAHGMDVLTAAAIQIDDTLTTNDDSATSAYKSSYGGVCTAGVFGPLSCAASPLSSLQTTNSTLPSTRNPNIGSTSSPLSPFQVSAQAIGYHVSVLGSLETVFDTAKLVRLIKKR